MAEPLHIHKLISACGRRSVLDVLFTSPTPLYVSLELHEVAPAINRISLTWFLPRLLPYLSKADYSVNLSQ